MQDEPMDVEAIRANLLRRRAELSFRKRRVDHDLARGNEPLAQDFADQATQVQNDEALEAIGEVALEELRAIDQALQRIANGVYGICTRCHEPIEPARLRVIPHADRCIACAEA